MSTSNTDRGGSPDRNRSGQGGDVASVARNTPGAARGNAMEPQRDREGTLTHVIETLLDKGLVINADIMVSVAGVELLGIRIRAALASFETAARYGLEFPAGTDRDTAAWNDAIEQKDTCPECGKRAALEQLLNEFCPWCGWKSAQAIETARKSTASMDAGRSSGSGSKKSAGSKSNGSGSASKQADK